MRIGIIGQPCIDEIVSADSGVQSQSLGGIFYSYAAMERLMREHSATDDRFVPLTWSSKPDERILSPFLEQLRHLDREHGLWPTDALTNRVQLVYHESGERTEHCPNVLPELTANELTSQLIGNLDGLFVNMISGFDVRAESLESALDRAMNRPFVHLDVHALVLGDLSSGSDSKFGGGRTPRGVRDWKQWLAIADSVQLNELEARWFGDPEIKSEEALLHYLRLQKMQTATQCLIVTRGARGATLYDLRKEEVHHVPPPNVRVIEPTGAGDVFGSAFIFATLAGKAPAEALRMAVLWATWCATLKTLEEILTTTIVT